MFCHDHLHSRLKPCHSVSIADLQVQLINTQQEGKLYLSTDDVLPYPAAIHTAIFESDIELPVLRLSSLRVNM
jgi:hypothetical protein